MSDLAAYNVYRQFLDHGDGWEMGRFGGDLNLALGDPIEVLHLEKNSVFGLLVWFTSWLNGAGHRSAPLVSYLAEGYIWGNAV